jgi:hypothetical protein
MSFSEPAGNASPQDLLLIIQGPGGGENFGPVLVHVPVGFVRDSMSCLGIFAANSFPLGLQTYSLVASASPGPVNVALASAQLLAQLLSS